MEELGIDEFTIEQAAVNTMRVLACEAVAHANSGHSGMALSAAPAMYAIYRNMKFDPKNGSWFNRDRFVMSAGHGSALLYATLKCFGVPDMDLKTFRSFGSRLTGHPELDPKICVDASTGPLGQGIAMAVGIAAAEKRLAHLFNVAGKKPIIDHYTYCLVGDGCLMEGVSYEACNLAGLWGLEKLIVVYDCNGATLDGTRESADAEDVAKRFKSMGWVVENVEDGNDEDAILKRIKKAQKKANGPTLIIARTEIGHGAKRIAGSNKAHGAVLTTAELTEMRKKWDLSPEPFSMDADVAEHFHDIAKKKINSSRRWKKQLRELAKEHPNQCADIMYFVDRKSHGTKCTAEGKTMSGRDAGHMMLNQLAAASPRVWGGNADVASTTKAFVDGAPNLAFGVREFAMAAICNGLALHGFTPFCSTFLAFSDYARPAMRLTALMNLPVTYIFTHDGIGNPPDGPTHQGCEHIAALRLIPNMHVFRPADDYETAAVFEYVFGEQVPSCILLSRGDLPSPCGAGANDHKNPAAVILASGAEVDLCVRAQKLLGACGMFVNVKSVPCIEQFAADKLNHKVPVIAVEMGVAEPWWALFGKWGLLGHVISFENFGKSGKEADVLKHLGFTPEQIAEQILKFLK